MDLRGKVSIASTRIDHIFRDAEGHLADTLDNRQLLIDIASNADNYLGTDKRYGNHWFAGLQSNSSQVWVKVRGYEIINGGINSTAKAWNPDTGLDDPPIKVT